MLTRNDGKGENNVLQNQFTAYLSKAIYRRKKDVLQKRAYRLQHEVPTDPQADSTLENFSVYMPELFPMEFENNALETALNQLTPRERYILFAHILDEVGFEALGGRLGLKYSGAAVAYHRVIHKLRKMLKGG